MAGSASIALLYPPSMTFWQAVQAGLVFPLRSEKYLDFVRSLPCCVCGRTGGEAHHIIGGGLKGVGRKTTDLLSIPLCREHHEELHRGHDRWEERYGTQLGFSAHTLLEALYRGVLQL